jgi:hypothetical protein
VQYPTWNAWAVNKPFTKKICLFFKAKISAKKNPHFSKLMLEILAAEKYATINLVFKNRVSKEKKKKKKNCRNYFDVEK